ncbi:OmpA family protein [Pedobacter sp. P351]|uniref:OmpA family protein n=1 Tax=Pedobacter superstes TaxID=3133441 RepID=UPI003096180D
MSLRLYTIVLFSLLAGFTSTAQIRVSRVDVNKWIKENFTGQGVVVGNIKFHGNFLSIGSFSNSGNVLDLQKGLVLSTGSAYNVAGMNNKYNQTYAFGDVEKDADLQKIVKPNVYDVSMVEFDFVPMGNSLQFNYQFGSEEYPEYVGSAYNDVFAFFVSDENTKNNIALIPGKSEPVSINTVNHKTNQEFFIDNNVFSSAVTKRQAPSVERRPMGFFPSIWHGIKNFFSSRPEESAETAYIRTDPTLVKKARPALYRFLQFDGVTKKLVAQTYVVPYKKYHLKIIIADVADNIYDSGVFVEDRSLIAKRDTMQPDFVDYPDLSKLIDARQILAGKNLEDLLPDTVYMDANIYFEFDKADIVYSELNKLKGIASTFDRVKNKYTMRVAGHTDSIGDLQYNMALSRKRNQSVMDALQKLRTIDIPIEITEDAYLKPAAKNDTDEGRMKNRRVEIYFVKRD